MAMQDASKYGLNLAANYYKPYQGDVNFPEQSLRQPSLADYPTMPTPEQYQAPKPKLGGFNLPDLAMGKSAPSDIGTNAFQMGGGFALQESANKAETAQKKYDKELARLQQEKYWWDPNYDVHAELDEYVEGIPSERDKLIDSTITGGALGGSAAEYAHHTGGKRALQGASMGGMVGGGIGAAVGAIVGGLAGLVEGFFTWGQAAEKDKELRRQQKKEYERDLRKWEAQRDKMIDDRNQQLRQLQTQGTIRHAQQKEAEKEQEEANTMYQRYQKRLQMIATLKSAAQMQQQRRKQLDSLSRHLQPLGS